MSPVDEEGRATALQARMRAGEVGFLHSFHAGSAVDGPGVRAVVWTTGCPFRCVYCHNPDTWKVHGGQLTTADDVMARIARFRGFWRDGGAESGGVTITGGEPLAQAPFARRIFHGCKQLGIHTALDTNGALGDRLSDADLGDIDLVLLDVKAFTATTHRRLTGAAVEPVIAFGHRLAALRRPVWIRHVLVPGFTDAPGEVDGLARLVAGWSNVSRVEVLPFHQLGESKWERLGMRYALAGAEPPSPAVVEAVRQRFRDAGI